MLITSTTATAMAIMITAIVGNGALASLLSTLDESRRLFVVAAAGFMDVSCVDIADDGVVVVVAKAVAGLVTMTMVLGGVLASMIVVERVVVVSVSALLVVCGSGTLVVMLVVKLLGDRVEVLA